MAPGGLAPSTKTKQRRITQACDYCHRRSIRCRPSESGDGNCQNCTEFNQPCTYLRKPRRRGARPRPEAGGGADASHPVRDACVTQDPDAADAQHQSRHGAEHVISHRPATARPHAWSAPYIASQAIIMDLVELYFEIVYPIFPFFHQPSYIRSISRAGYLHDKALFAATMAVCALVSSRVRDGSVTNPRWDLASLEQANSDVFYAEAKRQLAGDFEAGLNPMRAHAVMAIASIQNGNIRDMHKHLGSYHTLVSMDGLHDESNWPAGIGIVEREERRRLFWSMYTLDIYSAVVWGGVIRSREQSSNVSYPTEVDDEMIDNAGMSAPSSRPLNLDSPSFGSPGGSVTADCWLSGWNFITDLYRILEHALVRFHGHHFHARRSTFLRDIFGEHSTVTQASVRDKVLDMFLSLPPEFRQTPPMTYDIKKDRFGFQAANITGSVQLLRMVSFAASGASIEERCRIASEVVNAFMSVPVSYLLAISRPQLHHLGGIGAILGSVFEEPLTEAEYNNLRSIMLSMAQLLESLETSTRGDSASQKLRSHVARIDAYMATQRESAAQLGSISTTLANDPVAPLLQSNLDENGYPGVDPDIAGAWPLQLPSDILEGFTWNFDFG